MAERELLEVLEVFRQMPRQLAVRADHAVLRDGGDQVNARCSRCLTRLPHVSPNVAFVTLRSAFVTQMRRFVYVSLRITTRGRHRTTGAEWRQGCRQSVTYHLIGTKFNVPSCFDDRREKIHGAALSALLPRSADRRLSAGGAAAARDAAVFRVAHAALDRAGPQRRVRRGQGGRGEPFAGEPHRLDPAPVAAARGAAGCRVA